MYDGGGKQEEGDMKEREEEGGRGWRNEGRKGGANPTTYKTPIN